MYDWGKEQEKEIATIKERTIYLNLSDADCKRISTYAAKANITEIGRASCRERV